jgi:hypothetical protein
MLNQESNGVPDPTGCHVGGVAQEDGAVVFADGESVAVVTYLFVFVFRQRNFTFRNLKIFSSSGAYIRDRKATKSLATLQ